VFLGTSGAEFDADWSEWDLERQIDAVSGGELRLLPEEVPGDVHAHQNHLRVDAASLEDGWVALDQCHEHLDTVPELQITYHPERIRNLRITHATRIGRAWVEGPSVQLVDIQPGARLCVSAQSQALLHLGGGYYRLRNGPYMRRFLDGYYPMRVAIEVRYPAETLEFVRSQPAARPGFQVRSEPGRLRVATSFEGRLHTCLDFRSDGADAGSLPDQTCPGPGAHD
jgi:hypothetical protein